MPIEQLHTHTHDAGLFQNDWSYSTDATVDRTGARVSFPDALVLEGSELQIFLGGLNAMATPFQRMTSGSVSNNLVSTWTSGLRG